MVNRPLGAAAGVMADRLLGEPPVAAHPVAGFGAVMRKVETRPLPRAVTGWSRAHCVGVGMAAAAGAALRSPAVAVYVTVAGRSLAETALGIEATLERHDLAAARGSSLPLWGAAVAARRVRDRTCRRRIRGGEHRRRRRGTRGGQP